MLREIGDAEAERHRLEEGRNGHGNTLRAIPVADMEDRFVQSRSTGVAQSSVPCGVDPASSRLAPSGPFISTLSSAAGMPRDTSKTWIEMPPIN